MDKNRLGLLILKISTVLYGAGISYRIATGNEEYWSALVLPVSMALALWKPGPVGWAFLRAALFIQSIYYGLFFLKGLLWVGFKWVNIKPVLIVGGISSAFLVAALFIYNNKGLFFQAVEEHSYSWKKESIAILLAISMLFLPWVERIAWITFDPRVLDNREEIGRLRFSPDGKKIGVTSYNTFNVWDVSPKNFITFRASHDEAISSLDFSGDGKYVAIGQEVRMTRADPKTIMKVVNVDIWDLSSSRIMEFHRTEPFDAKRNSSTRVSEVAFSPNSSYLACATGNNDVLLEIWDIRTGKLSKVLDTGTIDVAHILEYSPDGKYLAAASARYTISLWDVATSIPVRELSEGNLLSHIHDIEYSPDGKYLALALDKRLTGSKMGSYKGFIDIWDTTTGELFKTLSWDSNKGTQGLSYSHDGKYIASFLEFEDSVNIWDVDSGKMIKILKGPVIGRPVKNVAFSPDGKYLAVSSGRYIKLYDAQKIGK